MNMLRNSGINSLIFILIILLGAQSYVKSESQLKSIFLSPPDDARPRTYWLWGHGNYDYTRISEDLKAFKEMGYGGVDIFDLGISDPNDVVPSGPAYMSEEQLDGVVYAMKEAKKLGLKMGLSVSNGWNAGGSWTEKDEMSMNILFWKDTVQGPVKLRKIGFPTIPDHFNKLYGTYSLYPIIGKDGFPQYYKDIALVAFPFNSNGQIKNLDQILHFNANKINGNEVDIEIPEGKWIILRSIVTPMGQRMWAASDNSHGYIMDHFSEKATNHHFSYLFNRLESRLGKLNETALERFYLCSFESEALVEWSPELSDYFFKLNGYSIDPYIPILAGHKIVDDNITQRFLHDYHYTISEMFVNNHYCQARNMCNEKGIKLASESGGPGLPLHRVPTEDYKALGAVDVMRGEFWNNIDKAEQTDARGGDILSVIKNVAGAAHVYGRKIVEMESFTSRKHWRENPFELKKLADYAFCNGMTRVVYHTATLSPKEAGLPGWSYSAGTHISPNLTWWPLSKPMHDYFSRVGGMLQQGNFVADVAYYKGEDVPNFGIGYKYIKEKLGEGYDYDDINTEILLQTTEVENHRIKLPCGIQYAVLVLPDNGKMSIEVLKTINNLILKGAIVIGNKPVTVYGLADYKIREAEVKQLADKIWGVKPFKKQIRKYGKGMIVTGYTEKEILDRQGIVPDFVARTDNQTSKIDYIHRSTDTEDIYFICNTDSVDVNTELYFRVTGVQPQIWNPVTMEMSDWAVYNETNKTTSLPLKLTAYESVFVVFSKEKPALRHIINIQIGEEQVFPVKKIRMKSVDLPVIIEKGNSFIINSAVSGDYKLKFSDGIEKLIPISENEQKKLTGTWDVRFKFGYGFNPIQKMDSLVDWVKHSDKELSSYSGFASYKLAFDLTKDFVSAYQSYIIDLGKVGEVARVFLNGEEVGTSLFPPHRLQFAGLLREGENNIVIEVANTWLNQYLADLKRSPEKKYLNTNVGKNDFLKSGSLPLPSGLIGPVKIIGQTNIIF